MRYPWWRRLLIVVPIAAGFAGFLKIASAQKPPTQSASAEAATYVRTVPVQSVPLVPKAIGYGTVRAARVWNAVARVGGEVEYVNPDFKVGAILKKGTEIIRIAPRDYELAIRQAEANRRASEAKIRELTAKQKSFEQSKDIERRSLTLREKQLARKSTLRARGTISQASLEEEENALLAQRQKLQNILATLDLIPSQISAQKEQREVYEAALAAARLNLERTRISLPFNARVAGNRVEVTQYVQVGTDMGSVDSTATAEVEVRIPQSHFQRFIGAMTDGNGPARIEGQSLAELTKQFGLRASLRLPLLESDAHWTGRVIRITDSIDPKTRTVGVIVNIDDPYGNVEPGERPPLVKGMFVEALLYSDAQADRMIIPRSALRDNKVYVVDKGSRLLEKNVQIAFVQGALAVVSEGLSPGEQIVVSDLLYATDGMLLSTTGDEQLTNRLLADASGNGLPR